MANSKTAAKKSSAKVTNVDPVRQPTTAALDRLAASADINENEVERWVRDDPARIDEVRQLGYDFKKDSDGEKISSRGLVLMTIPRDKAEERQASKDQRTRQLSSMGSGQFQEAARRAGAQTNETTTSRVGRANDAED